MTYTRNFPTDDKNLTIDLRRGDTSHPVFEGTQIPDWDAFRTVDQLRDVIDMYGIASQASNPTEVQRMRLEKITGASLCIVIDKLGTDQAEGLEVLDRMSSNRFNPGTAELCTKALTARKLILDYEARMASATS